MIPKIVQSGEHEGRGYLITDSRKIVAGLRVRPFDLEENNLGFWLSSLEELLKAIDETYEVRLYFENQDLEFRTPFSRNSTHLAYQAPKIVLIFEAEFGGPKSLAEFFKGIGHFENKKVAEFFSQIPLAHIQQLELFPTFMSKDELESYSSQGLKLLKLEGHSLWHQDEYIGIIQFIKPGFRPLSPWDLVGIQESLPVGYRWQIRFKKVSLAKSKILLEHRSKSEEGGASFKSQKQWQETQEQLSRLELDGEAIFQFEMQIVVKEDSPRALDKSCAELLSRLSPFGEFEIQSYGLFGAFTSSLVGGRSYWSFRESSENLPVLLPLFSRSEAGLPEKGSLALHRISNSPLFFSPFQKDFSSYSGIIIGQTGLGKSVFTSQLLKALAFDADARILLVDVKGSHSSLVQTLKGQEIAIDIENPSGFDPFKFIEKDTSLSTVEVLTQFVSVLIQLDEETSLPSQIRLELENEVQTYTESKPKSPSLDDFITRHSDHLTRSLELRRWAKSGLFGNVFKAKPMSIDERLLYFNFSGILQASNLALSRAVLASVMARFSFGLKLKDAREKLIFIADETPFFVRSCFESFRLLQKNVRSLNGSLFLICQDSTDLVVNNDSSLLNNAAIKVLFSIDGDAKDFQSRLHLSDFEMKSLESLRPGKSSFSSFLLKDPIRSRIGYLFLSDEEYWMSTTNPTDKRDIERLRRLFKGAKSDFLRQLMGKVRTLGIQMEWESP